MPDNVTKAYELLRRARGHVEDGDLASEIDQCLRSLDNRRQKRRRKKAKRQRYKENVKARKPQEPMGKDEPDWSRKCQCGATPIHPVTGMCGPCSFGEAETVGGNW